MRTPLYINISRIVLILLPLSAALIFPVALRADTPRLETGVFIQDGSAPLEVSYFSSPAVVDWDNDGNRDLLVGQYTSGHISLFLNKGSNVNPRFDGSTLIMSNGVPITMTYG